MNFRIVLYIFFICFGLSPVGRSYAQTANLDSIAKARQHTLDSSREAQKRYMDSVRQVRMAYTDSLRKARQHKTDSLAVIRKYKSSKHYKDSVAASRKHRLDSIKAVRTAYFDSVRTERKRVTDSVVAIRKARLDSIKTVQKHRSDSLAVIRKYRESKRYKDSVSVVRKLKLEKLKAERKAYNDSMIAERRAVIDSMVAERKAVMDSANAVRKKHLDSMTTARKVKTDSLAKVKEKKQKQRAVVAKQREQKQQMALELKIKKKREAWSNEKMLKKRWSVPRQIVQNTFTRYNYYFNTDRKMDEALDNMLRNRKENYDSLLALFPFNPDRDSALLAADMDSIIQKASVGIQIHDPRSKWGDDLYLLMGQAYYYKGGYGEAATTFKYIVSLRDKKRKGGRSSNTRVSRTGKAPSIAQAEDKNFLNFMKHRSVHNEGILWLARTYTQSGKPGSAESVLDLLDTDPNFPESLKGRLALERSYMFLTVNDMSGASKQLTLVAADNNMPDWIRMRASYLAGQIQQEQGNYTASIESFRQTLDLHPKIEMDFYARKNLAYSSMYSGGSQDEAVASLKKVLKDGKYTAYYEQVYYVMGRLAANNNNNKEAIEYLEKSLESTKSTKKQKALSFASLGGVYYKMGDYPAAKNAYDSVAALIASAPDDPIIELSIKRAMALGSVTKPLNTIHDQDSLLTLAALSEKEQRQAIRKYIRALEKKKADSAFLAENAGINAALQNAGSGAPDDGKAGRWYFANPVLMQQGYNEFKRKWNNRPLVDNWRRLSAISSSAGGAGSKDPNAPATEEGTETVDANGKIIAFDAQGLPTEESLLSFIPATEEEKHAALRLIKRSYIDLANAYVKELEDYPPAIKAIDTLNVRFPGHEYSAEALYIKYIIALRQGRLDEAEKFSQQLVSEFGDSKFADMVRPSESGAGLQDIKVPVSTYYEETYKLLAARQYSEVLVRVKDAQRRYTDARFAKRFQIIEGTALAGMQEYDPADSLLSGFIRTYPSDSLRPWADAVLEYVKRTRPAIPVIPVKDSIKTAKTADSTAQSIPGAISLPGQDVVDAPVDEKTPMIPVPKEYIYKPNEDQYVGIFVPAMEPRAAGVRAAISDFNTFKFGSLGLNTEVSMLQPDQGVIVTKKFKNVGQAKIYLNSLRTTTQIFREYKPNEYELFIISESNYNKMAAEKNVPGYLQFYKENYK